MTRVHVVLVFEDQTEDSATFRGENVEHCQERSAKDAN